MCLFFVALAAAAADYETDAVIQRGLRKALGKDVTVLTIAHRLRTVMDADKIVRAVRVLSGAR